MATIKDVANRAGVNIGTVSRVLNRSKGYERIGSECARRVELAAEELGYTGSYFARSMLAGRAGAIGVILPVAGGSRPLNWFTSGILCGVFSATAQHGCHCISIAPGDSRSPAGSALSFLKDGRIDGLVVPGAACDDEDELAHLRQSGRPVMLMQSESSTDLPRVNIDEAAGMVRVVDHLAALGHRRLLWIGLDKPHDKTVALRREAVKRQAARLGLRVSYQHIAPVSELEVDAEIDRYRVQCERLFREGGLDVTAAICYDDLVAIGAGAAARGSGLSVPEDLSIVGFDDVFAQMTYPPLTTVSHMLSQLAHRCVELLLEAPAPKSFEHMYGFMELLKPELIVRRSTRSPVRGTE